jgi:hypothetical protein
MDIRRTALATIGTAFLVAATVQGAQRGWVLPLKSSAGARQGAAIVRPQAEIGGQANGIYCTPQTMNGVSVHDLGGLPAGLNVTVTVEAMSEGFDPAAAVLLPIVGEGAGNNIKTTTFYDNDSGGDKDAKIGFVTPQSGNYLLVVNDYTDTTAGCYRYEVILRQ